MPSFLIRIFLCLSVFVLLSALTMCLWNWLMPELFGLKTVTLWQSMGLLVLSSLLVRSTDSAPKIR
ncbi:MAG: hypothetical protein K2W95_24795 [Candidatus Obscuribacterales bacterium]|nr:hypothetical protein [Candidatus Obscuribacterales bacterium]